MTTSSENRDLTPALIAADEARITAITSGDEALIAKILSDELHYAHSTGTIDDKASFTKLITSGATKYLSVEYPKREFTFPAAGIALMTGQARIRSQPAGKGITDDTLNFLAVWKLTTDGWRFHAWQSARLPVAQ